MRRTSRVAWLLIPAFAMVVAQAKLTEVFVERLERGDQAAALREPAHWIARVPADLAGFPELPLSTPHSELVSRLEAGEALVLIAGGERGTSGYYVTAEVEMDRHQLRIACRLDEPPPGVASVTLITQPWTLISVRPGSRDIGVANCRLE